MFLQWDEGGNDGWVESAGGAFHLLQTLNAAETVIFERHSHYRKYNIIDATHTHTSSFWDDWWCLMDKFWLHIKIFVKDHECSRLLVFKLSHF